MSKNDISTYAYDAFSPHWGMDTFLARHNNLEEYHLVWLKNHPGRTVQWLCERLREGFDIHHVDGNHDNNEPGNLALIEHSDHMRLHGLNLNRILANRQKVKKPTKREIRAGKVAYEMFKTGKTWTELEFCDRRYTEKNAQAYANHSNLPWPIEL